MSDIMNDLKKIDARFSDKDFLSNKGMSNEVGVHVFCYEPKDEIVVQAFFENLISNQAYKPYRIIECDLYKIFLQICEEKRIMTGITRMEETKGKEFLQSKLQNVATAEAFIEKMKYEPHEYGDIILVTGVGKIYPFMRSHLILNAVQPVFPDVPVVMLYPGKYNGRELNLFDKLFDANYYRAFNLI